MGGGKTLFATLYAKEYSRMYPKQLIYSNFKLKLPNSTYSPFLLLPFSQLKKCLIIADDYYALQNVGGFVQVVVNLSRKLDIDIIITCQYYTMVTKMLRTLANELVEVTYDISQDILLAAFDKSRIYYVENAVKLGKKLYDTKEVVKFPTDTVIEKELLKVSATEEDLELNCQMMIKDSRKRKALFQKLKEKL